MIALHPGDVIELFRDCDGWTAGGARVRLPCGTRFEVVRACGEDVFAKHAVTGNGGFPAAGEGAGGVSGEEGGGLIALLQRVRSERGGVAPGTDAGRADSEGGSR